jgi:hypothetical protein
VNLKGSKDTKGGPHHVSHPLKGGFDDRGYVFKGKWRNCSLVFIKPLYDRRLQIKRTHHRAFGPANRDRFMNGFVKAAGRSHSDHTLYAQLDAMSSAAQ